MTAWHAAAGGPTLKQSNDNGDRHGYAVTINSSKYIIQVYIVSVIMRDQEPFEQSSSAGQ